MRFEKQFILVNCLNSGYYKIVGDQILTKKKGEWKPMKGNSLPSGYKQVYLSNHKRGIKRQSVLVYWHIALYIAAHGSYPEGLVIDHKDGDKNNFDLSNLRAVTHKVNNNNRHGRYPEAGYCERPIRGKEIQDIKRLMNEGYSQAKIARELDLNRLSVRYTIKNIEQGKVLKFENYFK